MAQTVKSSACNAGDLVSIPGSEDSLEKENPGKCHGWRNLIGYSPWGHKESDTLMLNVCKSTCTLLGEKDGV